MGKDTAVSSVDSVANLLKDNNHVLNDQLQTTSEANEIEIDNNIKSKKIIIKKQSNTDI